MPKNSEIKAKSSAEVSVSAVFELLSSESLSVCRLNPRKKKNNQKLVNELTSDFFYI